jgi:S-(hydroxymethyl)glutathione dehydrogenase/alcohol dehydrogenase
MTENGTPVAQGAGISAYANFTVVDVSSAVKVSPDLPLETACLVGCGVATGYGSAVNSAQIEAGDTVIIMGVGGIGINAVQGAALRGAAQVIAVDPVEFKREMAAQLGATHTAASIEEASELAKRFTDWQGADAAIVCVGETRGDHIAQAFASIRKGGTVVMTGVSDFAEVGIPVSPTEMTLYQKRLQGSLYGQMNPNKDIPRLLEMYRAGKLHLDELVTRKYRLDDINDAFKDMHDGRNIRGVIVHEH